MPPQEEEPLPSSSCLRMDGWIEGGKKQDMGWKKVEVGRLEGQK